MATDFKTLTEEAGQLARGLFENPAKQAAFTAWLTGLVSRVDGKDFLLIHNPGGWGSTSLEHLLQWERSIIEGVNATMSGLGYDCLLIQYFRSGSGWGEILRDVREQERFFLHKSKVMAAELEFILKHCPHLQVILIGVSQGAAFSNAVLQRLPDADRLFSIELGVPFFHQSRRIITARTLSLDSNGLMPDALMGWNVPVILKTYFSAPLRWLKYRLKGKKVKFTYCINLPGHDYNWDYPEVRGQIAEFLKQQFGTKR